MPLSDDDKRRIEKGLEEEEYRKELREDRRPEVEKTAIKVFNIVCAIVFITALLVILQGGGCFGR